MKSVKTSLLAIIILIAISGPALAEVDGLGFMLGRWDAETQFHEDGDWKSSGKSRAIVDTKLGNSFYVLQTVVPFPGALFQFELIFSQDRFNGGYRATFLDDLNGYMDVYAGDLVDGLMTLDNRNTGTAFPDGDGGKVYGKLELSAQNAGFQLMTYISVESDGEWTPYMRILFKPAE